MLFTFPSRYWSTIGRQVVFSLRRWSSQIPTGFHVSRGTWVSDPGSPGNFRLQDFHLLWSTFPGHSANRRIGNFPRQPELSPIRPHDPEHATLPGLTHIRFGLFPVRSPLLGKSQLFSSPEGTKMFQFPSLPPTAYVFSRRCRDTTRDGFSHSEISGSRLV